MSSKADIDNMCVFVMNALIKKTMKDESISVNKEIIWDEAKLAALWPKTIQGVLA